MQLSNSRKARYAFTVLRKHCWDKPEDLAKRFSAPDSGALWARNKKRGGRRVILPSNLLRMNGIHGTKTKSV